MSVKKLDIQEAYNAMFEFLASYYERTQSDDVGALLGSMSLLDDGKPVDPAVWQDWRTSLRVSNVNNNLNLNETTKPVE